ncbi:MAG: ribosome maturation factor RimM [Oscillospiraceae bacterium]|jgi:16S rRNA processing protein RimM
MKSEFIEAGLIVNTHGINGEVRIEPWCDSADFLKGFKTLYLDGEPLRVVSGRIHKNMFLATFEGYSDINSAMRLKGRVLYFRRSDAPLPEGRYFIADLIGLEARDADTGKAIGIVKDVLSLPANDVYVISGERDYLVPAVPAFIDSLDIDAGFLTVKMQRGLAVDDAD